MTVENSTSANAEQKSLRLLVPPLLPTSVHVQQPLLDFFDRCDLQAKDRFGIELVIDEVVSNVIRYGEPPPDTKIEICLFVDDEGWTVEVIDEATPYDPRSAPVPDLDLSVEERPIGGLGVELIRQWVDRLDYERVCARNRLTAFRRRESP
ncbi:MAG: ATP-binding protein [Acidobacteriota bacterium]